MSIVLGWAEKKGGLIKNWKRRFFVISGQKVFYYASESGKPKGSISLSAVTKVSKSTTPRGMGLALTTSSRVWEIARIEGDAAQWVEQIASACPLISQPSSPTARRSSVSAQSLASSSVPMHADRPQSVISLVSPLAASTPAKPPSFPAKTPPPEPAKTPPPEPAKIPQHPREEFGLLLCGSGESGKTTFLRQLQLQLLPGGIEESNRVSFVPTIRGNLIESMQLLLVYGTQHDLAVDDELVEQADLISSLNAFNCEITIEIADALEALWSDESVQEAFAHRDETVLPDHMEHFFAQVQNIMSLGYIPSDADILKARIRTIGIGQLSLQLEDVAIRFFDLGGQRNERSKMDQIKGRVRGLVFCVPLADFDKPMFEALPAIELRIHDSIAFFAEILKIPEWGDAPVFLICNKFDGFREKVQKTNRFACTFPEYRGGVHDVDECARFVVEKFRAEAKPGRQIEVFNQVALDSGNVMENAKRIARYVRENCLKD